MTGSRVRRAAVAGPELFGARVHLRPLGLEDFASWAEVRRRCGEWLWQWEPRYVGDRPSSPEEWRRDFSGRIALRDRDQASGTGYSFGIFLGEALVGEVSLSVVLRGPFQSAFLGYWVDERYAGRELAPEAAVVVLRFAFERLGLHRVDVAIVPRNGPSRRVAEKLRLREEGVSTGFLQVNGRWEDHVRYAITVEEWLERRASLVEQWLSPGEKAASPPESRGVGRG
jgi:ribosomal-protein-alanine N-acetyltransferase